MTGASSLLRTLLIYAVCLPLGVFLGYVVGQPDPLNQRGTYIAIGLLLLAMCFPILMRWHRFFLIASWNLGVMLFFLPASPSLWLPAAYLSLFMSILQYIIQPQSKFLSIPSVTRPLLILVAIVLVTAACRGGIGFAVFGSETFGGKKYLLMLSAVVGYFAFIAQRIPPRQASIMVAVFFLGFATQIIGDLVPLLPSSLYWIYNIFPPTGEGVQSVFNDPSVAPALVARFGGYSTGAAGILYAMLAYFGVRGIMTTRRPLRFLIFSALVVASLIGGFRSALMQFAITFFMLFYLEGLMGTRLLPVLVLVLLFCAVMTVGFVDRMPLSIQRTLSFLPIDVNPIARLDAEGSNQWRLEMWRELLPEIPKYLLLGKGLGFSGSDLQAMILSRPGSFGTMSASGSALAGDFHNGPLSVLFTFGIWGMIAFTWFIIACFRALYQNYRFGPPAYSRLNAFLLAYFTAKTFLFVVVVGSLYSDLAMFIGIIGLNLSLNGGVAKRVLLPRPRVAQALPPLRIHPARRPIEVI